MTYIFSIEGNIGSGKSTLVKELKKSVPNILDKKVVYVQEPVSEWSKIKDKKGETILEKFYEITPSNSRAGGASLLPRQF